MKHYRIKDKGITMASAPRVLSAESRVVKYFRHRNNDCAPSYQEIIRATGVKDKKQIYRVLDSHGLL